MDKKTLFNPDLVTAHLLALENDYAEILFNKFQLNQEETKKRIRSNVTKIYKDLIDGNTNPYEGKS
jgi:hypothetical protein